MLDKEVPKEWLDLVPEELLSFIESKVSSENLYSAMNTLICFQDLTHKSIDWNDRNLITKLIQNYL